MCGRGWFSSLLDVKPFGASCGVLVFWFVNSVLDGVSRRMCDLGGLKSWWRLLEFGNLSATW